MAATMTMHNPTLGRLDRLFTSAHLKKTTTAPLHPALAPRGSAGTDRRASRTKFAQDYPQPYPQGKAGSVQHASAAPQPRDTSMQRRSSAGLEDARRLSTVSLAMQQRRASQSKSTAVPAKPRTRSIAPSTTSDTSASSASSSTHRRASKMPHHDPEVHHRHYFDERASIPRPFYAFVASCHHVLDKLETHIVPESVHDMDLRDIRGCIARDGQIQEISYCYGKYTGIGWKPWRINKIKDQDPAWYWKIQQDILQLYNDYHRMEYPEHHRPSTWADVAHNINDPQTSRMEEFIRRHCVLHMLSVGGQKQPVIWTNAHLRRIAEKKHGKPGKEIRQLKIKGSSWLTTIHVDETLDREWQRSEAMIRHNETNKTNVLPALPSMHEHFELTPPAWYHTLLVGGNARPRIEGRRRSRLALQDGSQS